MEIKHLLFDLDGTLLPMVQEEFVKFYMPLLAKAYLEAGVRIDPKKFIGVDGGRGENIRWKIVTVQ